MEQKGQLFFFIFKSLINFVDTKYLGSTRYVRTLGTVFDEILTSIYLEIAFILGLQTLQSIDLSRMYCLKGLEPQNKGYFQIDGC